jgi:predicted CXXCH cytochrome family protein
MGTRLGKSVKHFVGKSVKHFVIALGVAGFFLPTAALGQTILGTLHDFTAYAPDPCVTCHTSHNAEGGPQGLWNHKLSSNTFSFGDNATTLSGTRLPTNISTWKGISRFCLSCHDGSVAVGAIINGASWGTEKAKKLIGENGNLEGTHPVAIPYPDQEGATYNNIVSAADPDRYVQNPQGVRLYGNTPGEKGMECGSCHNPHENPHGNFLRVERSAVCTSCHIP